MDTLDRAEKTAALKVSILEQEASIAAQEQQIASIVRPGSTLSRDAAKDLLRTMMETIAIMRVRLNMLEEAEVLHGPPKRLIED